MTYFIWTIPLGVFMLIIGPLLGIWWLAVLGVVLIAASVIAAVWTHRRGEY